jgi:glutaredoxin
MLGKDVTIQDLQARVADVKSTKLLRSAPQIFVDDIHVGDYKDFVAFLENKEANCNA